jgi:long-chain acyl-CoA synthetase
MSLQANILDQYDLSSLQSIMYGSSPMDPEWIQRAMDAFPQVELIQTYGLTETSPLLTALDFDTHQTALESGDHQRLKSCGRPLIGVDLQIVDEAGRGLPPGEVGEVAVRGPNVFKGYLNLPQITESVLRDGWFHTGDVGRVDEAGYLYIMDRKKDVIITGGENVYSSEVETVLYQHPAVFEAAVFGLPDEQYGEQVCAAIVLKSGGQVEVAELIDFCRKRIGGYKIPRRIEFLEEMPKSAVGKILKRTLREMF